MNSSQTVTIMNVVVTILSAVVLLNGIAILKLRKQVKSFEYCNNTCNECTNGRNNTEYVKN